MIKILYSTIFPIETDRNINKFFFILYRGRKRKHLVFYCLFVSKLAASNVTLHVLVFIVQTLHCRCNNFTAKFKCKTRALGNHCTSINTQTPTECQTAKYSILSTAMWRKPLLLISLIH